MSTAPRHVTCHGSTALGTVMRLSVPKASRHLPQIPGSQKQALSCTALGRPSAGLSETCLATTSWEVRWRFSSQLIARQQALSVVDRPNRIDPRRRRCILGSSSPHKQLTEQRTTAPHRRIRLAAACSAPTGTWPGPCGPPGSRRRPEPRQRPGPKTAEGKAWAVVWASSASCSSLKDLHRSRLRIRMIGERAGVQSRVGSASTRVELACYRTTSHQDINDEVEATAAKRLPLFLIPLLHATSLLRSQKNSSSKGKCFARSSKSPICAHYMPYTCICIYTQINAYEYISYQIRTHQDPYALPHAIRASTASCSRDGSEIPLGWTPGNGAIHSEVVRNDPNRCQGHGFASPQASPPGIAGTRLG